LHGGGNIWIGADDRGVDDDVRVECDETFEIDSRVSAASGDNVFASGCTDEFVGKTAGPGNYDGISADDHDRPDLFLPRRPSSDSVHVSV